MKKFLILLSFMFAVSAHARVWNIPTEGQDAWGLLLSNTNGWNCAVSNSTLATNHIAGVGTNVHNLKSAATSSVSDFATAAQGALANNAMPSNAVATNWHGLYINKYRPDLSTNLPTVLFNVAADEATDGWINMQWYSGLGSDYYYLDCASNGVNVQAPLMRYGTNVLVEGGTAYNWASNAMQTTGGVFTGWVTASNLTANIIRPVDSNIVFQSAQGADSVTISSNGAVTASTFIWTNSTTMAAGLLGGTNGVYWTALGTNYWITFQ
jgi:hypothetical protein